MKKRSPDVRFWFEVVLVMGILAAILAAMKPFQAHDRTQRARALQAMGQALGKVALRHDMLPSDFEALFDRMPALKTSRSENCGSHGGTVTFLLCVQWGGGLVRVEFVTAPMADGVPVLGNYPIYTIATNEAFQGSLDGIAAGSLQTGRSAKQGSWTYDWGLDANNRVTWIEARNTDYHIQTFSARRQ